MEKIRSVEKNVFDDLDFEYHLTNMVFPTIFQINMTYIITKSTQLIILWHKLI